MTNTRSLSNEFPSDPDSQIEFLDEFDGLLAKLSPEILFSARFHFLLDYFFEFGDDGMKKLCNDYILVLRSENEQGF